jgi:hypothetical protein
MQQTRKMRAFAENQELMPKYSDSRFFFFLRSQNFVIDDFVICDRIL